MEALAQVILPVFLVIGAGYAVAWRGLIGERGFEGLMTFAQSIAIPCLLFAAIASLDLGRSFDVRLLGTFYAGAVACFVLGILGARHLFGRPWPDAVAIGFCALFSNSLLLGLPITERAYGTDALSANYAIISIHAPFCYAVGVVAMEITLAGGGGLLSTAGTIVRALARNPMVIGIGLGFAANLTAAPIPEVVDEALALISRAALPTALFGLGGVLFRYRPEGSLTTVLFVSALSLLVHPALVLAGTHLTGMAVEPTRSAVITSAMAPGVNAYLFAHMYGVAKRVAATSVLVATILCMFTAWMWLALLP